MKELWFKTEKDGNITPVKIVVDGVNILYPQPMFTHINIGETLMYYRVKDNEIIKRPLKIDNVYQNKDNIWTIEGDFGERL